MAGRTREHVRNLLNFLKTDQQSETYDREMRTAGVVDRTVSGRGSAAARRNPPSARKVCALYVAVYVPPCRRGPCPCATCLVYGARISIVTVRPYTRAGEPRRYLVYLGETTTAHTGALRCPATKLTYRARKFYSHRSCLSVRIKK